MVNFNPGRHLLQLHCTNFEPGQNSIINKSWSKGSVLVSSSMILN